MPDALPLLQPILLPLRLLERNTGQIKGVPQNARFIRDEKYKKLVKSITDHPGMMSLRELLVYHVGEKYVVLGGNMRLRALSELGYKEAPCKVIDPTTPEQELRAIVMKDNIGYGEHDWEMVANEWDVLELEDWGLDIPEMTTLEEEEAKEEKEKTTIKIVCATGEEMECVLQEVEKILSLYPGVQVRS